MAYTILTRNSSQSIIGNTSIQIYAFIVIKNQLYGKIVIPSHSIFFGMSTKR